MGVALESEDLWKTYDGVNWVLRGASLEVEEGEVFAMLGRNGAGKTTFIRIASTLLKPSRGTVRVLGRDVMREAKTVRRRIAIVPQEGRPSNLSTPWAHVYYYLIARGMTRQDAARRAREYLEAMELWDVRNVICGSLSGGLRQRVYVAMAMATEAEVLFLDEPTIGLDPISRTTMWSQIRRSSEEGRTVIVTTHNMEEAETISDRVSIINSGRIAVTGSVEDVMRTVRYQYRVDVEGAVDVTELRGYGLVRRIGDRYRVLTEGTKARELADLAIERGWKVNVARTSLEDAFVLLAGGNVENEAA
ncbi:MAG: ABC transporter ATP-binding protein [Thaumarchaeota archaeon]|nr:ABC transporter ATP-binding protein [Candidatus Calditenuaceae archaeon]MDW8187045.1 ABC transporter ATP-binding protein [Nitrososphaerota archaeon]